MRKRAQALYWAAMTRDLIGYGEKPPAVTWPGGARVAVNVVINYEEGSENRVEDGQGGRESMGEAPSPVPAAQRDLANESFFEYGSRAGFWRLLRVLDAQQVTGTVFACAVAFERNPEAARAVTARGWDICAHGHRWEEHWLMDREAERAAIARAVTSITETSGQAPLGWYCRYGPSVNTRELVVAQRSTMPSIPTTSASGAARCRWRRILPPTSATPSISSGRRAAPTRA